MTSESLTTPINAAQSIPTAVLRTARRVSPVWLVPLAALLFVMWLGWRAWEARGVTVIVQLPEGHGLKTGDDVRYRGIAVGIVDSVTLSDDLHSVVVTARLVSQSDRLARSGARFWVVRPELGLTRIEGLDTIIGPRFLAVLPGDDPSSGLGRGRPQRQFVGLMSPPLVSERLPGDLEIVLEAPQRGSLVAGGPVFYRQTRIGTILSVGLAGDGGSVEARAHVQQPYVPLIRERSRFWDAGGLKAKVGLTGFSFDIQSAEALLAGGVALATPPEGGEIVRTGHRFRLDPEPKDEWSAWKPMVAIGNSLLPPGESPPSPLRAGIAWEQGSIISREKSLQGWVLQTDQGVLGPANLLTASEKAQEGTVVLEVSGDVARLTKAPRWQRHGLAMLEFDVPSAAIWPMQRVRRGGEPEECVVIADASAAPLPIAAARMTTITGSGGGVEGWNIDPAITIDPTWHGACVIARSDGKLIGMIVIDEDEQARIAAVEP